MHPLPSFSPRRRLALMVLAALVCLLLSSCSAGAAEMDITVYTGDRYELKAIVSIPTDALAWVGGQAVIESELESLVAEAKAQGKDVSWRQLESEQSDAIQYEIRTGITKITGADTEGFTWRQVRHNNRQAYRFEFPSYAEMSRGLQSFTLTLHAGRILESNGRQIDARTVRWSGPNQTPYAVVQPKGTTAWITLAGTGLLLVAAILLLVAAGGLTLYLALTGRLKAWGSVGISAAKWRVQAAKLGNDRSRAEKERKRLLSDLGARAWQARVAHPSYAELYAQLEALDQQRAALREQIQAAEQQLRQVQQTRAQTDSEYAARLRAVQEERAAAARRLSQARAEYAAAEKRLRKVQAEQQTTQAEIQSLRSKLAQALASAAPDSEAQAASLSSGIAALEQSLAQSASDMSHLQSEIARLHAEQQPLVDEVNRLDQERAQVQAEQRQALAPLDQQIAALQGQIRSHTQQSTELERKMTPLTHELGPLVDRARPASPELSEVYARLDQSYRELADLTQKHDLLKARLGAADGGAARNFYLVVGGLLLALILSVLLLVIALAIGLS